MIPSLYYYSLHYSGLFSTFPYIYSRSTATIKNGEDLKKVLKSSRDTLNTATLVPGGNLAPQQSLVYLHQKNHEFLYFFPAPPTAVPARPAAAACRPRRPGPGRLAPPHTPKARDARRAHRRLVLGDRRGVRRGDACAPATGTVIVCGFSGYKRSTFSRTMAASLIIPQNPLVVTYRRTNPLQAKLFCILHRNKI